MLYLSGPQTLQMYFFFYELEGSSALLLYCLWQNNHFIYFNLGSLFSKIKDFFCVSSQFQFSSIIPYSFWMFIKYSCLENPWTEEPGRLQSMGSLRVRHDWATSLSLFTFIHWRRKWQPTPVFLPGESRGTGEPGGLPSMGSHRVGHDWSDLAAAAAAELGGSHEFSHCMLVATT